MPIWREAADVGLLVLEVASCDALLGTQVIRVLREEGRLMKRTMRRSAALFPLVCSQSKPAAPQ